MFSEVLSEYNKKCDKNNSDIIGGFKALSVLYKKNILEIIEESEINELIYKAIEVSINLDPSEIKIQEDLKVAVDMSYNRVWKLRSLEEILNRELKNIKKHHLFILLAFASQYKKVLEIYDVLKQRDELI